MNPETLDSLELEEDTTLPEADKASALANPKIRLAVLALALVSTIGTLWAGISHYRYTQALTERNTAVEDARTAFEDTQKARQEAEPLLPKTLGEVMFAKGLNDLKQALSTPMCTTQITMPAPETRQEALAQADAARAYATECEQHTTNIRAGIEKAKVAAQKGKANEMAISLNSTAHHLQRDVDLYTQLGTPLPQKEDAHNLIEQAFKQERKINAALENNQLDQLDALAAEGEKILTDFKALQEKINQTLSEWSQNRSTNSAADNTTNAPAHASTVETEPTNENTYSNNTQGSYTTPAPTSSPSTPQASTPATGNTNGNGNSGGWVTTTEEVDAMDCYDWTPGKDPVPVPCP